MIDFLTSPGGGLLWDIFLLALGIFITVVTLQRILDPTLLEQFEENLDATLRHSAAIFLARDPALSRMLGDFREWLTRFKRILEGYREVREAGSGPGRDPSSDLLKNTFVQLRELITEANGLQTQLVGHADESGPFGSDPAHRA